MNIAALTLNQISVGQLATYLVVAAALIAIVWIALTQMGVAIPPWVIQIGWVIVVCFVALLAIRVVLSM